MPRDTPPKSILFICRGNTCRSPMAEALAKRRWRSARVASRGIGVSTGAVVALEAISTMDAIGLDISGHVPTQIALSDLAEFETVISLAPQATAWLEAVESTSVRDLRRMHVRDPYGSDEAQYRSSADEIARRLARLAFG